MKLLIIGDLHGRKPKIHFRDFDAVIVPGDVSSDKEMGRLYKNWFQHLKKYPETTLDSDKFFAEQIGGYKKLRQMEKKSLREGRKILEFLDSFGKPIFIVPGNWDQSYGKTKIKNIDKDVYNHYKAYLDFWLGDKINLYLINGLKNMRDCQYKLHEFRGINFIGYGLSSAYENPSMRKKSKKYSKLDKKKIKILENSYKKINNKLEKVYRNRKNKNFPTIFISHNIPYKTLDKVKAKYSTAYGKNIGSTVTRNFILKNNPLICAGGHVHEYFGKMKLKKTTVINAGFGGDKNVLVEIDEKGKIKKIKFHKSKKF